MSKSDWCGRVDERRGVKPSDGRELRYCSRCKATSAFERQVRDGKAVWVCAGDQRSPKPREGCGWVFSEVIGTRKVYGGCLKCRAVVRVESMPDGLVRCLTCGSIVTNGEEYGSGRKH